VPRESSLVRASDIKGLRKAAIERVEKPGRRQECKIMVHSQKAFGRVLANAPHTELKPPDLGLDSLIVDIKAILIFVTAKSLNPHTENIKS
jgi:hypothetical protein